MRPRARETVVAKTTKTTKTTKSGRAGRRKARPKGRRVPGGRVALARERAVVDDSNGDEPPFSGIRPSLRRFLGELAENNDRDWFDEHRERFEDLVRTPLLALVRALAPHVEALSPRFLADDRRSGGSLLRVYRDVRFSADKRPYHTSMFVSFPHKDAERGTGPGFGLRVRKDAVLLTAGLRPAGGVALGRMRRALDERADEWLAITAEPSIAEEWDGLPPPALVRVPQGFDPGHPCADDLRRRDFRLGVRIRLRDAAAPSFPDEVARRYRAAAPVVRFTCEALGLDFE